MHKLLRLPAGVLALLALVVAVIGFFGSLTSTDGGTIAVIRNGGWLDSHDFRQVVPPGSSLTATGWWSEEHDYSAAQRYFKVSGAPSADSNEVIQVPTKDGVLVGVEGTYFFDINRDSATLGRFDDAYGTRTYQTADPGKLKHAWEGEDGWNAFLAATIGNLVQNDLRRQIGGYQCADLVASCALAQNSAGRDPAAAVAAAANGGDKLAAIQESVNASFAKDVTDTLGGPYFNNIKFTIAKVDLPAGVQGAINDAQAAFAGVTKAQAGLQAAQVDAQANAARQSGYQMCPTCGEIDKLKALPQGLTTYVAPGGSAAVAVGGK